MDEDNPLPNGMLQTVLDELQIKEKVVQTQWVVKYTAVVKERGVVENKGYTTPI
jgi:glutamate--cysteine ligase regulatory subunit